MVDLGSDLSCVDDLSPQMTETSGKRAVAEAVVRRWTTPRGALLEDPDYGFDVGSELGSDLSHADIARINAGLEAEALKDERVLAATVTVTLTGGVLIVAGTLTTADGPFTLVVAVSAVSVSILNVQ